VIQFARFEVPTVVKIHVEVFWFVVPCDVVGYHSFGGAYFLHLHGEVLNDTLFLKNWLRNDRLCDKGNNICFYWCMNVFVYIQVGLSL
jgi:hypothetical protein